MIDKKFVGNPDIPLFWMFAMNLCYIAVSVWLCYDTIYGQLPIIAAIILLLFPVLMIFLSTASYLMQAKTRLVLSATSVELHFPLSAIRILSWSADLPAQTWSIPFAEIAEVSRCDRVWSSNRAGTIGTLKIVSRSGEIYEVSRPLHMQIDVIVREIKAKQYDKLA